MHEAVDLAALRKSIDAVDAEIASLLRRRKELAATCQPLKTGALYCAERETAILTSAQEPPVWAEILRSTRVDLLAIGRQPTDKILPDGFSVIAGPCAIESEEQAFTTARALSAAGIHRMRGGCWKPRTSPYAFQGHGADALQWMRAACDAHRLELWTEIRDIENLSHAQAIDVAWVGTRNAQNYELLRAIGKTCHRVVLKRGAGMTIEEWLNAAEYIRLGGASVALCERGIRGFDTMLRNTLDIAGAVLAAAMGGYQVIIDPSHSTGIPALIKPMVAAARAAGLSGAIIEAHPNPEASVTDAAQALPLSALADLL